MKKGIIIAVVLAVIGALIWVGFRIKAFIGNLSYSFGVTGGIGAVLGQLSGAQTTGDVSTIPIQVYTKIDNNNNSSLTINGVEVVVSYNGSVVLSTNKNSAVLSKIVIPAEVRGYTLNDSVNLVVNQNTLDLVNAIASGKTMNLDINIKAFGSPLGYTFGYPISLT